MERQQHHHRRTARTHQVQVRSARGFAARLVPTTALHSAFAKHQAACYCSQCMPCIFQRAQPSRPHNSSSSCCCCCRCRCCRCCCCYCRCLYSSSIQPVNLRLQPAVAGVVTVQLPASHSACQVPVELPQQVALQRLPCVAFAQDAGHSSAKAC